MKNLKKTFSVLISIFAVCILIVAFSACPSPSGSNGPGGNGTNPPFVPQYRIGDTGPGGGKIFYVDPAGFTMTDNGSTAHYLEAAPNNTSTLAWASPAHISTNISGTELGIGTGRKNTTLILTTDSLAPAAKACDDYSNNGYSDWFLPSRYELYLLYQNKSSVGNLGINYYWSSS